VIYDLLFKAAAEATLTIAADPKHLGARIGITAVLHSWGSAMTHHPHVHMIVPGGGISVDGSRWVCCRPSFFLPVRVLSRLFRRPFLQMLSAAHAAGRLKFRGDRARLADQNKFGVDLSRQQEAQTAAWYSPAMYNIVRQNGEDVHIVIKPDKDCVVNSGLGSVRGARIAEMSYSRARNTQLQRLTDPMVWRLRPILRDRRP